MFDLNDETRFILGLPNFRTGPMAHRLRELGHDIKTKCEDEQAYTIHWLIWKAINEKQARNQSRIWPDWRLADPEKAIEHVRGESL